MRFTRSQWDTVWTHTKGGFHNILGMAHNCGNCEAVFCSSQVRVYLSPLFEKRTWLAMSLQHEFPISHILTLSPRKHLQSEGEREGNKDYMQIKNFTPVKAFKKGHDVKKTWSFLYAYFYPFSDLNFVLRCSRHWRVWLISEGNGISLLYIFHRKTLGDRKFLKACSPFDDSALTRNIWLSTPNYLF